MKKQESRAGNDNSPQVAETARQERSQGGQPQAKKSGDPKLEKDDRPGEDDKLRTSLATPGDVVDNGVH